MMLPGTDYKQKHESKPTRKYYFRVIAEIVFVFKGRNGLLSVEERLAYVQGLVQGLGLENDEPNGKVLVELIDIMSEMADTIAHLEHEQLELEDYLDMVDEDLSLLEEEQYADELVDIIEIDCPNCSTVLELDAEDWDIAETIDLVCPNCGESLGDDAEEEIVTGTLEKQTY